MFLDKQLELIIFDLDGTLINTDAIYSLGWKTVLKEYNVTLPDEVSAQMNGQSTEENNSIVNTYLKDPEKTKEARRKREEFVIDALEMGVLTLKPGARELLDKLKKSPYKLALATSSPRVRGERIINRLGLLDYFEVIIYGDEVEQMKPSPEIYLKVLEKLNVLSERAIAIEDSRSGVLSALDAELRVLLVTESGYSELIENDRVYVFKSLMEIKNAFFNTDD